MTIPQKPWNSELPISSLWLYVDARKANISLPQMENQLQDIETLGFDSVEMRGSWLTIYEKMTADHLVDPRMTMAL